LKKFGLMPLGASVTHPAQLDLKGALSRADAARDQHDWIVAAEQYGLYLNVRPDDFDIWVQYGHALKESGQHVAALTAYSEALGLNPHDADLLLSFGHLHRLMGQLEDAISFYRRSAELDGNLHALGELKRLGIHVGPRSVDPKSPVTPSKKRSALWRSSPAIRSWLARLGTSPTPGLLSSADDARDRGDWDGAAEKYHLYLKESPDHFAIWVQLGHALKEQRRFDESLGAYEAALSLNGDDADLLLNLGHLNKLMGNHAQALAFYQRSAAQDDNPHALGELAGLQAGGEAAITTTRPPPMSERLDALPRRPLLSIVVPAYNTAQALLAACLRSVFDQTYPQYELIVVDDASPAWPTGERVRALANGEARVVVIERARNGGIAAATNDGVAAARGEYILFLDHDDELTPDALLHFAEHITRHPDTDAWYSDQLKIDDHGAVIDHFYKPDWSPTYMLGVMYVGHLLCVRASLCHGLPFDSRYDGVQDWEFMLRLSERTNRIGHIPSALYKWRATAGSIAAGTQEKDGIDELQQAAAQAHLGRIGRSWTAVSNPNFPHRLLLKPGPSSRRPKVSIIIPSKDQGEIVGRCLDSIFTLTDYDDYEVVLVDNRTTDPVARAAFGRHPIKRVVLDEDFNYSRANNLGVAAAEGELILFLNNDTEVLAADWLQDLVLFFEDPGIGAVGPTLLYPDRTVQHAGVVLGARGTADHVMRHFHEAWDGYAGSLVCAREVSAVTAACLMLSRRTFDEIGGFSTDYAKHYQDVDMCLKIRETGRRIIAAGFPRLIHHESLSRKAEGYDLGDRALLVDRWHEVISAGDPYFNSALNLHKLDYSLAT
jgi:GT2 family glycosyltransferase/predicted TPR repeat methyltransferase